MEETVSSYRRATSTRHAVRMVQKSPVSQYKACSAHGAEEPCEPGEKQGNVWCPETLHCLLISSTVMMVSSSRRAISARRAVSLHYTTLHCMVQSPDEPGGWHGADARDETGDIANR
eukprot:scaffold62319_cov18-Tisochrysis_lutea.AAC.1